MKAAPKLQTRAVASMTESMKESITLTSRKLNQNNRLIAVFL